MLYKVKRLITLALITLVICMGSKSIYASQDMNLLNWSIDNINLEHKSISFDISNVPSAQNATVVIEEDGTVIFEKSFSINSSSQTINVDVTNNYIKTGRYILYVKNASGSKTSSKICQVPDHSYMYYVDGTAYPNCFDGELDYSSEKTGTLKISAEVDFNKYTGTVDSEGKVHVDYPLQQEGKTIVFKIYDEYGCEKTFEKKVENKISSYISLNAWHSGVSLRAYDKLYTSERLAVKVDGNVYYSEYGATSGIDNTIVVAFPSTTSNTITYWIESKFGSKSNEQEKEITACELSECDYSLNAYQFKVVGSIKANNINQIPVRVTTNIAGTEYTADIAADGSFSLSYPSQANYTELTLLFSDEHACMCQKTALVYNGLESNVPDIDSTCILPTSTCMEEAIEETRLVAQIGNDIYYGEYGAAIVTYPSQPSGTGIKLWLENINSNLSDVKEAYIYSGAYEINISARTNTANGDIYIEDYSSDYEGIIESGYALINGEKYDCSISKKIGNDDDWFEDELYYHFVVKYPLQKIGTKVSFYFTDNNGITTSKTITLKNISPKINVNKIDSSSNSISGTTTAKSNVKITVGKKTYNCKANSKGTFSVKIKQQKKGTKVKISVISPEGYTNNLSTTVKQATGYVEFTKYVYKSSDSVKIKVQNAKKGDKVKVTIGSKTYTKNINSNKKTQNITVKIDKSTAGKTVKATLCDKFSKKKDTASTMVYVGDTIYKGMSAKDAELTTWGRPSRKNDYGWTLQWVYEYGRTTLYVYIKNGKVSSIQKFNY